jgi:hypothetical protein
MFMAKLRAFAGRLAIPNANQMAPALNHRAGGRDWDTQAVSWKNTDPSGEQFAN